MKSLCEQDAEDRERLKSRCKAAPAIISSYHAAYDAWQRYQQYKSKADSAFAKYMQASPGGNPSRRHHTRYLGYADVADGWERVLDDWLRDMAQLETDGDRS
jgi:hypothetical protein